MQNVEFIKHIKFAYRFVKESAGWLFMLSKVLGKLLGLILFIYLF